MVEQTHTRSYDDATETYARELPELLELYHEDVVHIDVVGDAYTEPSPLLMDPYTAPDTVFSCTHEPSLGSPLCESVCLVVDDVDVVENVLLQMPEVMHRAETTEEEQSTPVHSASLPLEEVALPTAGAETWEEAHEAPSRNRDVPQNVDAQPVQKHNGSRPDAMVCMVLDRAGWRWPTGEYQAPRTLSVNHSAYTPRRST